MDFNEALNYLYGLGHETLTIKFGLDNINHLTAAIGSPQRKYPSVLIAGTNGKGSTAAMVDSIGRAAGLTVGLYTSPHLIDIEERIRINGELIGKEDFARLATRIREAAEGLVSAGVLETVPTFFEQVTAIAFLYFAERGIRLAVLEVGLGGRLDATNIVQPLVAAITPVDFDHQAYLGNTIEQIASEKAAIIKPGTAAVIAPQRKEASAVIMKQCLESSVLPVFAGDWLEIEMDRQGFPNISYQTEKNSYRDLKVGLRGRHQAINAVVAIHIAELLQQRGLNISSEAVAAGLSRVEWPGRLEMIEGAPSLLLDGAHNPAGARVLREFLDEFWPDEITLVFAAMKDKEIDKIASILFPRARNIVLTRFKDRRAASPQQLAANALRDLNNVIFTESVPQALDWARSVTPKNGLICVTGSLYLVGETKQWLEQFY